MGRARWSPADRAWLDAHPGEGLPPDPYWHNGRRDVGPRSPWVPIALSEEERATLVAEGRQISQQPAHSEATLAALATIARVGRGL